MKFTVTCEMKDRWVPDFLGMLKTMQDLGKLGCSRNVTLFSDGDGDFRPMFEWNKELPDSVSPRNFVAGEVPPDKGYFFDAG